MDILVEWLKKQPHLPQEQNIELLSRIFLRNKFRIEKTKEKLDKFYSLRGIFPEFFQSVDSTALEKVMEYLVYIPMPVLTDKQERVIVWKIIGKNVEMFDFLQISTLMLAVAMITTTFDYAAAEIMVYDFDGFSLAHFTKLYPNTLAKLIKLYLEAFSARISSIQYVNPPPFVESVLALLRPILKAKIFGKIRINRNIESFHEVVPRKCLPKEYGGELKSIFEMRNDWKREFEAQSKYLEDMSKVTSDESKRIGKLYDNEMFGTDGTFKKLNLD